MSFGVCAHHLGTPVTLLRCFVLVTVSVWSAELSCLSQHNVCLHGDFIVSLFSTVWARIHHIQWINEIFYTLHYSFRFKGKKYLKVCFIVKVLLRRRSNKENVK
jgi:hypothetical protein